MYLSRDDRNKKQGIIYTCSYASGHLVVYKTTYISDTSVFI